MNEWNNEIQRAMAHPIKRGIIEFLRDADLSFTELYKAVGNGGDHGKFGYHLRTLKGFVEFEQSTQKYRLTHRGRLLDAVIRDFRFITQTSKRKLMKYVQTLEIGDHAIGFYDDDYLKRMMSFPFIKAGLENHEAVYYVIAEHTLDSECQEIKSYGIDVESFPKGALTVMSADEWFLKKGKGQPERIIANWRTNIRKSQKAGFTGVRGAVEMDLMLNYNIKELLRLEATLGRQFDINLCGMCLYDTHRLDEEQFIQLNRSHGHVISKDIVGKAIV